MEQTLWPRHCVQESWGAELHKDLKVRALELIVDFNIFFLFHRFIPKLRSFTRESIQTLIHILLSSTMLSWAKRLWRK